MTPIPHEPDATETSIADIDGNREAVELAMGTGEPQRVGRFRFYIDGQRWEWSENVERLHGYEPGTVTPTTELLLSHKHPDDRQQVAAVLDKVVEGEPFSSRHRIIDTAGRTHWVIVVGDQMLDEAGNVIGTSGFYVDFTDTMQSDISTAVSKVTEARAEIEQAKRLTHGRIRHQRRSGLRHPGLALAGNECQSPRTRPPLRRRHGRQPPG